MERLSPWPTSGRLETPVSLRPFVFSKRRSPPARLARGVGTFVPFGSPLAGDAEAPPPLVEPQRGRGEGLCDARPEVPWRPQGYKCPAPSPGSFRSRRQGGNEEALQSVAGKEKVGRVWGKKALGPAAPEAVTPSGRLMRRARWTVLPVLGKTAGPRSGRPLGKGRLPPVGVAELRSPGGGSATCASWSRRGTGTPALHFSALPTKQTPRQTKHRPQRRSWESGVRCWRFPWLRSPHSRVLSL